MPETTEHNELADSQAALAKLAEALAEAEDMAAASTAEMSAEARRISKEIKRRS